MASFQKYKTKDGYKWLYKYYSTVNPSTGKKKQTTKRGFNTKKEAQLDAGQTEQDLANGTFVEEAESLTFEEVYKQWLATHSPTIKPSTRKTEEYKFNKHILPNFGKLKIRDISKPYCQEIINRIAKELKTADAMKMYANQIFKYAVKMDIVLKNPMEHVVVPKNDSDFVVSESTEKRNYWEKHEIKQFLSILKEGQSFMDHVMFHLFIYTGARKGEILALHESDIDFKNKILTLNKTLYHENKAFSYQTSKTAASKRSISLDDVTLRLLRKWLTHNKERHLSEGMRTDSDSLLFARFDGTPLRMAYPNDRLNEIITKHNLHKITVHGLRHTHASLLFEAGANIKEVQERLGHSDIKMTMNIYTHVTKTVKEQTAQKFQKFLEL
ncbi:site-specific integrase [Paenibacillus profundus]|uniref:Site-specific integrase n=1 Tax=Paenibacillus profundus TaxID=1173085 RepID=A0ABS8YAS7_9BACL|nr:site-specific integrase [Paenibacillus profundus]MCE5168497.1 site-specific integrase [Paenibacillus profundus]